MCAAILETIIHKNMIHLKTNYYNNDGGQETEKCICVLLFIGFVMSLFLCPTQWKGIYLELLLSEGSTAQW